MIKNINLVANQEYPLPFTNEDDFGLYFANFPVSITVHRADNVLEAHEDARTGCYIRGPFTKITLTSAYTQTVKIVHGRACDITVQMAAVDVQAERVISGNCFTADVAKVANVANYSHVQLYNPVGSGAWLEVFQLGLRVGAAGTNVGFVLHNAAALTNSGVSGKNMLAGGAEDTIAELRTEWAATLIGDLNVADSYQVRYPEGTYTVINQLQAGPLILPEGYGLLVADRTVQRALTASFSYALRAVE